MSLKIEVGKTYLTRDGREVTIKSYDPAMPFFNYIGAMDGDPGRYTYTSDGAYGVTGISIHDLVSEKPTPSTLNGITVNGIVIDEIVLPDHMAGDTYAEGYNEWYESTYSSNNDKKTCFHRWKTYIGLMEKFDYCTECNIKREDA